MTLWRVCRMLSGSRKRIPKRIYRKQSTIGVCAVQQAVPAGPSPNRLAQSALTQAELTHAVRGVKTQLTSMRSLPSPPCTSASSAVSDKPRSKRSPRQGMSPWMRNIVLARRVICRGNAMRADVAASHACCCPTRCCCPPHCCLSNMLVLVLMLVMSCFGGGVVG